MKILPHRCTCASQYDTHDQVNMSQYQHPMSMAICKILKKKKSKGVEVNMMGISKQKSAPILVTLHICPQSFFFLAKNEKLLDRNSGVIYTGRGKEIWKINIWLSIQERCKKSAWCYKAHEWIHKPGSLHCHLPRSSNIQTDRWLDA